MLGLGLYHNCGLRCLSFPFLSFPFLSFPFLSFPFLSFPFLSFPFLLFSFLSFPFLALPYLTLPYLTFPVIHETNTLKQNCYLYDNDSTCPGAQEAVAWYRTRLPSLDVAATGKKIDTFDAAIHMQEITHRPPEVYLASGS